MRRVGFGTRTDRVVRTIAICYQLPMGQILVRQLDDAAIERLKQRARERKTSVEALAREAIHRAAVELSPTEKMDVVREMRAKYLAAVRPGVPQTPGVDLIREDRDR